MKKKYLKGVGMLVGMIFGAGIFALPFATVKAGVFWGGLHFLLAFTIMIFLHLWYGEVAYNSPGKHRFPGYAEIFLGRKAKWPAFLIAIFTDYGALFVYGFLAGLFLANLFGISPFILSLLVFAAASFLIFLRAELIATINFYLSIALFGLVIYLFATAFSSIQITNFFQGGLDFSFNRDWFLPYGIWIFALAGFAVLPEVTDIVSGASIKHLKKIILIGLVLCAAFYSIFVMTIAGVSGQNTTEDALSGLATALGKFAIILGSVLGFLAVFTSFIALGADLKNIFRYDFDFSPGLAWFGVSAPPVILFLLGAKDFIKILGITGAVGLGLTGILIILMRRRLAKQRGESGFFPFLSWLIGGLTVAGIIAALIS